MRDGEIVMLELRGKAVAEAHKKILLEKLGALKENNTILSMAIILVGDDKAAAMYAKFMEKTALQIGFGCRRITLPTTATQEEVIGVVQSLNEDPSIHGILPLMPMPSHIHTDAIIDTLAPQKDIDGLTTYNIGRMTCGKPSLVPCTAKACMAILAHYNISVTGKKVVVVGRSQVIGKPVALMVLAQHGTVTICHSRTVDLPGTVKEADIVIAAAGKAHMITADMVKTGAVIIDVGINDLDGTTVGDVDYTNVSEVASAITPVPGGVGSVTTTMMLESVYEAYQLQKAGDIHA